MGHDKYPGWDKEAVNNGPLLLLDYCPHSRLSFWDVASLLDFRPRLTNQKVSKSA